jgi:hypothetical protein
MSPLVAILRKMCGQQIFPSWNRRGGCAIKKNDPVP